MNAENAANKNKAKLPYYLTISRSRLEVETPNFQFVNSAASSRKIKPKHSAISRELF